ncbi:MAG: carbohydrate porin [Gammaproteobacteria bacterium]
MVKHKNGLLLGLAMSAVLAAPVARADNPGDTSIGGLIFTDLTSISTTQDTAAGSTDKDPNGFGLDVKRGYFIVNHTFDDAWSANLTTDFNLAKFSLSGTDTANSDPVTVSGNAPETQLFVKNLYLQGHFNDWATLRVGAASMPWTSYVESVYGYRFVENTMTDRSGYANTADWGVNLNGKGELVNYSASLVNGGGYKNPGRSKGMDFEGRLAFTPLDGDLIVALGGYTGKRGLDTEATPATHTASRADLLLAWKASGLTVGLEWFSASDWNNVTTLVGKPTDDSSGASLFASYDFPGTPYSVFGRYDDVKPLKDTDPSQEDKYYNAGFAWKSSPNITWALAYKSDKVTDNQKLGNTMDALKTQEFGIWAQIKY